jgi:catechol 2,3-dioxygenase-like lactoylglutathione lyase family enzyme
MRIGLVSVFVHDQDHAERFYTQVLGFKVKTNAPYGPDERWLNVVAPEDPDGVELVLHRTDEPARAFQQASHQLGRPVLSLRTDDCLGEAERLTAKGVVFVKEPGRMAYGGTDAVFDDTWATSSTSIRADQGAAGMPPTRGPHDHATPAEIVPLGLGAAWRRQRVAAADGSPR